MDAEYSNYLTQSNIGKSQKINELQFHNLRKLMIAKMNWFTVAIQAQVIMNLNKKSIEWIFDLFLMLRLKSKCQY